MTDVRHRTGTTGATGADHAGARPAPVPGEIPGETSGTPAGEAAYASGDVSLGEVFHRVNAFFYNKKTGLALILAMAFLTLMGTLLIQAPDAAHESNQSWEAFLASVKPRYGGWTSVLAATGMFAVFGSLPFKAVSVLLALSIIACTCHRAPQLWQRAIHPHTHVSDGFFEHAGLRSRFTLEDDPEGALATVRTALRHTGHRIVPEPRGPGLNLYADRFRWAPFGTVLAHASFVIILCGVLVTTTFGFQDDNVAVAVGTRTDLGHGTGLAVEARGFQDKYTDEGRPIDYYSDLVLYKDGAQVAAQTVRVNQPLRYDGIAIHQASYGIAAGLTVTGDGGAKVFEGTVPLSFQSDDKQRSIGKTKLADKGLTVYVVSAASGVVDQEIGAGQVLVEVYRGEENRPSVAKVIDQGKPTKIGDLTYTFERERQYTGLMIVRDPGALWVWIGSGLMVIGLILTMGLHHRRLWVRVTPAADGRGSDVRIASPERHDLTYERWFHRFSARLADPRAGTAADDGATELDALDRLKRR